MRKTDVGVEAEMVWRGGWRGGWRGVWRTVAETISLKSWGDRSRQKAEGRCGNLKVVEGLWELASGLVWELVVVGDELG